MFIKRVTKEDLLKNIKEEIIKLVTEQGRKSTHVARDIGVSESVLRSWVKQPKEYGKNAFPGSVKLMKEDEKLRELKKKLADIEEENAKLKKLYASSQSQRNKISIYS